MHIVIKKISTSIDQVETDVTKTCQKTKLKNKRKQKHLQSFELKKSSFFFSPFFKL